MNKAETVETFYYNFHKKYRKCAVFSIIEDKIRFYFSKERDIEYYKSHIELLKSQMKEFTPFIDSTMPCNDDEKLTAERKCNEISSQILDIIRTVNFIEREIFDLKNQIEALPEREQKMLRMRYSQGKSLRQIGYELYLTEARVSQLRITTINKLANIIMQKKPL
jgi:DNA-directed RNA polymerase specialized sigma subunit